MKKIFILSALLLLFFETFSKKSFEIGVQFNPLLYFKQTDSGINEATLGINSMVRLGFEISNRFKIGFGTGVGLIYEFDKYSFYNKFTSQEILFDFNSRINTFFFNPYLNYKLPINKNIGFIFEFGNKLTFIKNNTDVLTRRNGESFSNSKSINQNEFESSIYIRPGFYVNITENINIVFNYFNLNYSFGKRINQELIASSMYPNQLYLLEPNFIGNPIGSVGGNNQKPLQSNNSEDYLQNFNKLQFVYNLTSFHIGIFIKVKI